MPAPAETPRRKVSREGVVLLKSFEGFRARAERDGDGWVIGYGHRKSAREGLTVGEADAELLLQYDLLPVVAALNALPLELNPHQFDALASFVFSVGVDRFQASDVHARLTAGQWAEAADALLAWDDEAAPTRAARRRAAERALFLSPPGAPTTVADLLSAPLPSPSPSPAAARAAAVAALLGDELEPGPEPSDPASAAVIVPAFEASGADAAPSEQSALAPAAAETVESAEAESEPGQDEPHATPKPEIPEAAPSAGAPTPALGLQRQSSYAVSVIGPLPGFARAAPAPQAPAQPPAEPAPLPPPEIQPAPSRSFAPSMAEVSPLSIEPLVLTPAPEEEPAPTRPVWDEADRPAAAVEDAPLLMEAPPAVSILRHEAEPAPTRRFDWSETGAFLIMGGVGLAACAVSAAAFRLAVESPSPMGETAVVAWVLAGIGAVSVGAASWHLWVKTRRRG